MSLTQYAKGINLKQQVVNCVTLSVQFKKKSPSKVLFFFFQLFLSEMK